MYFVMYSKGKNGNYTLMVYDANSKNPNIKTKLEYQENLKQSDLVTLTGLGKSAISQYLSGKVTPKGDKLLILAKALNVSVSWLMGEKNAIEPTQNIDTSKKKGIKIPVLGKVVSRPDEYLPQVQPVHLLKIENWKI